MTNPRPATGDADRLAGLAILLAHGTGNDFVVVVDPDDRAVDLSPATVRALCDRHLGLGADGLLRVAGPPAPGTFGAVDVDGAQVTMDYRNGDGSVAEMCGNGIRVTARVALAHGLVAPTDVVDVATRSGVRRVLVELDEGGFVAATVDMGPASSDPEAIGLAMDLVDGTVHGFVLAGIDHHWVGRSMGNPHVVTTVGDLDAVDLAALGPTVETHAAFRDGVNVNVAQVVDDHRVRLRTWERGVGATLACGSGTCATVAALVAQGRVARDDDPVVVEVGGGELQVVVDHDDHLVMAGPATIVGRVDLDPDWVATVPG